MGERARCGGLARVSNVVSDHGRSGAGRDDANRRQASVRRLGVVERGSGTIPLVLLHGWPQTSYAWRHVTPLLTSDCHALAYDLPGIGSSELAIDRFDKWSICGDLHAGLGQRGIQRPLVAGHGMGAQVAYAYLRRYPTQVRGVMLLDTPIAGVGGCEDLFTSPAFWHIGFHQAMSGDTGLAELLVTGREHGYFRSHIDRFAAHPDAITDADTQWQDAGARGPGRGPVRGPGCRIIPAPRVPPVPLPVLSVQLARARLGIVPLVMRRWPVFDRRLRLVLATCPEADTALAVRAETFALTIPRDHQDNDHGNRNHRRYQDHHKNVLEDPVPGASSAAVPSTTFWAEADDSRGEDRAGKVLGGPGPGGLPGPFAGHQSKPSRLPPPYRQDNAVHKARTTRAMT